MHVIQLLIQNSTHQLLFEPIFPSGGALRLLACLVLFFKDINLSCLLLLLFNDSFMIINVLILGTHALKQFCEGYNFKNSTNINNKL
jgi:hypothetical protein